MNIDDLEKVVPYYLTDRRKDGFLKELKSFMDRDWIEYFSKGIGDTWLQGDCCSSAPKVDVVTLSKKNIKCLIVSNSCDIDPNNDRVFPAKALIAPLIPLDAYKNLLLRNHSGGERAVDAVLDNIKAQKVTNIFYLPHFDSLGGESIALLDDLQSIPVDLLSNPTQPGNRYFSLSQIGFFLFLFKLSVHLCRFHEEVERPSFA